MFRELYRAARDRWQRMSRGGSAFCLLLLLLLQLIVAPAQLSADELQYPQSVAANKDGTLFIADRNQRCIWKVTDGKLETLFQASPKLRTPLNAPLCVAVDGKGRVLVGDSATREIYRFQENGEPQPLTQGGVGIPISIAFGLRGEILVSDMEFMRVVKIPEAGGIPEELGKVHAPRGIAVDERGKVWAVSHGPNQVVRLTAEGKPEPIVQGKPFQFPSAIAFDPQGNLYVSDGYGAAIWKVSPEGQLQKWVSGEPFRNPVGVFWNKDRLLVADPRVPAIFEVTAEGNVARLEIKQRVEVRDAFAVRTKRQLDCVSRVAVEGAHRNFSRVFRIRSCNH